jgi:hypothetical protein
VSACRLWKCTGREEQRFVWDGTRIRAVDVEELKEGNNTTLVQWQQRLRRLKVRHFLWFIHLTDLFRSKGEQPFSVQKACAITELRDQHAEGLGKGRPSWMLRMLKVRSTQQVCKRQW